MSDLKPGDVVQLRSGGPQMTVDIVHRIDRIEVVWFPKGSGPVRHFFSPESLKKVNFEVGKKGDGS